MASHSPPLVTSTAAADETLQWTLEAPTTMPSIIETTPPTAQSDDSPAQLEPTDFTTRTHEFWSLPIPKSRRYDPERPIHFGLFLNFVFADASTVGMYIVPFVASLSLIIVLFIQAIANSYYNNPLLSTFLFWYTCVGSTFNPLHSQHVGILWRQLL